MGPDTLGKSVLQRFY